MILATTYRCSIALAMGLLFWSVPATALPQPDHALGVQAAQKADYGLALAHFQVLAAQGHAAAQYNLAMLYANGLGVPLNAALAIHWAKKSAGSGYVLAIDWLEKFEQGSR